MAAGPAQVAPSHQVDAGQLLAGQAGTEVDVLELVMGGLGQAMPRKACAFLVSGPSSHGVLVAIEAHELLPLWYPSPSNGNADPLALLDVATTEFAAQAREKGAAVVGAQDATYKGRLAMWLEERCGLGAIESITPSEL